MWIQLHRIGCDKATVRHERHTKEKLKGGDGEGVDKHSSADGDHGEGDGVKENEIEDVI